MRRLEIADLNFCETEFENSGKVQGGIRSLYSYSLPINELLLRPKETEVKILEEFLGDNGEKMKYFQDKEKNSSGLEMLMDTDSGRTMFTFEERDVPDGGKHISTFVHASSFF